MKRIISLLLTVAMLAGCALALASCGAPEDEGAQISVYLGDTIYDFDPTEYYVDSNAEQVMSLLFEPLFVISENGKLKNGVADDYTVDKKNRTIVIDLRETYWSDSVRVTAADFIFAWRDNLLEPNDPNPAAALLYDIENAAEIKRGDVDLYDFGAVASNTYELTITYREGADYEQLLRNLASVATSPLREDMVTVSTDSYWSKVVNSAVTNGPFAIADMDAASFTLSRNVGYHQDPAVKDVTGKVTPSTLVTFNDPERQPMTVSYADIESKTVFYMGDASLADRASYANRAIVADDLSTYTYVFNTENPLFANEKVRQALSMVINRDAVVSAITFGKAATGLIPYAVNDKATGDSFRQGNTLINTAVSEQTFAEATALINDAGISNADKRFTLTVADTEEAKKIAALVCEAWGKLGFTVTVDVAGVVKSTVKDFATNTEMQIQDSELQIDVIKASKGKRDFDVIAVDWQMYSDDPFVALSAFSTAFSGCGRDFVNDTVRGSFGGWSNADYDALISAAYSASTKEERSAALHAAEQMLISSACIAPIVFNQSFAFVNEDLSDIDFSGFGNIVLTKADLKNYKEYLD